MPPRECVTHHHACDCREERFAAVEAAAWDVLCAYDENDDEMGPLIDTVLRPALTAALDRFAAHDRP